MATDAEKQKLYDMLKFTPRTYSISMWGYGGEIVMGKVDRKIFDYFKYRRLNVNDYAWSYDYAEEENIPEEFQPFEPGSWYECDEIAHTSGVDLDSGTLQITDENGDTVIERDLGSIDGTDIQMACMDEAWIGMANAGEVVFIGRSSEKGTFFEGEIELTKPFDPELLTIYYDEVDGESLVTSVTYDDVDIDNNGANTNGKSSDFGFFLVKDDKSWEKYENHDSIEYQLTDWFPKKINPVRTGLYMIKTPGKKGYEYQAQWTGSRWIGYWQEDNAETETLKIKEWRGIAYDPDSTPPPVFEKPKPVKKKKEPVVEVKIDPNAKWPF